MSPESKWQSPLKCIMMERDWMFLMASQAWTMFCYLSRKIKRLYKTKKKIPWEVAGVRGHWKSVTNIASKKLIFKNDSFLEGKRRSKTDMFGHFRGAYCAASQRQNLTETGLLLSHRPLSKLWSPLVETTHSLQLFRKSAAKHWRGGLVLFCSLTMTMLC